MCFNESVKSCSYIPRNQTRDCRIGVRTLMFLIFFFKQKTAYEMRISDWSSDVCSSDLRGESEHRMKAARCREQAAQRGKHDKRHHARLGQREQIGRASCRERVCQYV